MIREIVASLLLVAAVSASETQELFNGKDLTGWDFELIDSKVPIKEVWSVSEGVIICKGRPPGIMRTKGEYSNYELTVEWRWAPGGKAGNSGVLIHASTPRDRFVWPKSIEVQLAAENAGDFWVIGESLSVAGGEPQGRRWVKKASSAENPPGEWNTVRIRCEGAKATVWVNGTLMNEGIDLSTSKGAICLQSEDSEVHFRKVLLTPIGELPVP